MQRPGRIAALLLALPGLAVPFLPFVFNVLGPPFGGSASPLETMPGGGWWGTLTLLGAPFFLAIPIVIWQTHKLFAGRITFEIVGAYALSASAMISVLWFIVLGLAENGLSVLREIPASILACSLLVVANVALLWRNRARYVAPDVCAEVFLLGGYLPNAAFYLLVFGRAHWPALVTCIAYAISIALALRTASSAGTLKDSI